MSRDPELRLGDIIEACERVASYISGMDASEFRRDAKTQDAVIRQFEIIGEAVKGLSPEITVAAPDVPWPQIARFRDVLAHSYFAIDPSVVWDAASAKAPLLKEAAEKLLGA